MFLHVGVVGSGLEGDVKGDGQVEFVGFGDEAAEVLEGAELGMNRLVAALC